MALPIDFARAALQRIAQHRIPPTPENYTRYYHEAAGAIPPPGSLAGGEPHWLQRVGTLVDAAAATTQELAGDLDRCSSDLAAPLAALLDDPNQGDSVQLLHELVATARDMQATVRASHAELLDTQRSLAEIKAELIESRKLLGKDPLTGTENRRSMSVILEREVLRARSEAGLLCVAMVDVDYFKNINDIHGHAAGDAALVHLTAVARSLLRGADAFIRYGGEEFLLILPETGSKGALFATERLQTLLEKSPLVYDGKTIVMTFSAGVSELRSDDTEQTLVKRADAALYEAKRAGRKRVVVAE